MKNLITRSISGAVYVALIVCSILFGQYWGFPSLCCIFLFIGVIEYQKMTQNDIYRSPQSLFVDILTGISLLATGVFFTLGLDPIFIGFLAATIILGLLRLTMQLYSHRQNTLAYVTNSVMSVAYVAVPLTLASMTFLIFGPALTLLMFIMIWLNDTGAFLVGSAIGSHRLFERLSPKKSWEGFFGGLVFSIVAGILAATIPDISGYFAGYNSWMLGAMGLLVSVMSTWGDLFESMIKRQVGVKDSGNLIPGHGGILDRIDSLLFVAPAVFVYLTILFCYTDAFMLIQNVN